MNQYGGLKIVFPKVYGATGLFGAVSRTITAAVAAKRKR
jgi:hypothetical protein